LPKIAEILDFLLLFAGIGLISAGAYLLGGLPAGLIILGVFLVAFEIIPRPPNKQGRA
jgi:hypothetical protein